MTPDDTMTSESAMTPDVRARILAAASRLIAEGGGEAATTRAVAAAAGVQPPTIYRFFGDKQGLLAAVAEHDLTTYVAGKEKHAPHPDPVEDLRQGWDMHVDFCLSNPGLFAILTDYSETRGTSTAATWGKQVLERRIRRIARSGRLTTSEEQALAAVEAAGSGTILALLGQPEGQRNTGISAFIRDMVIAAITKAPDGRHDEERRPQAAASQLRASLDDVTVLTAGERHLLGELLERIASSAS
ncbi:TetR/AcrR family transcriptional regulator [Rhizobium puerariae]|uniref:TetR/AcrR family transcriptional regulator n=1 Tax=Rhizobium puerariae TaxID=1585791 RepID=A0ABV6ADT4_9HYPH